MATAVDPSAVYTYVLKEDRELPREEQTKFKLRSLSAGEQAKVKDSTAGWENETGRMQMNSGTVELMALRFGLVGWEGFRDASGNEVEFDGTKRKVNGVSIMQPSDAALSRLAPRHRMELAEQITNHGSLTPDEVGN